MRVPAEALTAVAEKSALLSVLDHPHLTKNCVPYLSISRDNDPASKHGFSVQLAKVVLITTVRYRCNTDSDSDLCQFVHSDAKVASEYAAANIFTTLSKQYMKLAMSSCARRLAASDKSGI